MITAVEGLPGTPVQIGSEIYSELLTMQYQDARYLDTGDFSTWLNQFHEDIRYSMPCRITRLPKDGPGFDPEMEFFSENHISLSTRVKRLETDMAWSEQPGSRTRHFVSNTLVRALEDDRYLVVSSLMVTRMRDDLPYDMFTGERRDQVVRTSEGFKIIERVVLLDQTVLRSYNLSIFF